MPFLIVFTGIFIASAVICHITAKRHGRNPVYWGVMGALFGPLTIPFLIYVVMTKSTPQEEP